MATGPSHDGSMHQTLRLTDESRDRLPWQGCCLEMPHGQRKRQQTHAVERTLGWPGTREMEKWSDPGRGWAGQEGLCSRKGCCSSQLSPLSHVLSTLGLRLPSHLQRALFGLTSPLNAPGILLSLNIPLNVHLFHCEL